MVVGVGHTEMANVLITVAVGVTDERCFVVVMELGVRDSDEVGSVGDIQETIVVILAVIHVAGKIAVINPDVGGLGLLDGDGVARSIFGLDILDNKIANNDIARMDGKTKAVEDYRRQTLASMSPSGKKKKRASYTCILPDDGGVGSDRDVILSLGDVSRDNHDFRVLALHGCGELLVAGDFGGFTAVATSCSVGAIASINTRTTSIGFGERQLTRHSE